MNQSSTLRLNVSQSWTLKKKTIKHKYTKLFTKTILKFAIDQTIDRELNEQKNEMHLKKVLVTIDK